MRNGSYETYHPARKTQWHKRKVSIRQVVNGLRYVLSIGSQWRGPPKDLPPEKRSVRLFDLNRSMLAFLRLAAIRLTLRKSCNPAKVSGQTLKELRLVFKLKQPSAQYELLARFLQTIHAALFAILVLCTASSGRQANDPRDDRSPWGVASGAEFSAYPIFNPMLKQAGVQWLRSFYEWQTVQPKQGYWNFALPDRLVENARANRAHLIGVLAYFAPWASADGGTRRFPIKDIQFWRDYVRGMVERYRSDIKYWEIWNEFNGSFAPGGTPGMYAELVREASLAAKEIDPAAKIGMSVANFDVRFLDAAIKAGAANYFDYICVHPYEIFAGLSDGGEPAFLNMTATLRKMLAANHLPEDIPLWITEIGSAAPLRRDDALDQAQASLLAKAYLLSIASGFERVFWFEARGPSYGHGRDFGLIRSDMTRRPSYDALKVLTTALGPEPVPAGWLDLGEGSYGFVFDTQKNAVLAAWARTKRETGFTFDTDVRLSSLTGESNVLPTGKLLTLTATPVLITGLPAALAEKARAQKARPYPWAVDYSSTALATALLGADNVEHGVKQVNLATTAADTQWRRTDFSRPGGEGHYVYFWVDPQFVPFGMKAIEITAVVRRIATHKVAGMTIDYESSRGYVGSDYQSIPEGDAWQEISWKMEDANFVGAWGWSFRLNGVSSPHEFLIKEVKVRKVE
jgi:polysaccharide biosynthesis protein PslG